MFINIIFDGWQAERRPVSFLNLLTPSVFQKATDLASVIHSNIKYRKAAVEHLEDQQSTLERYLVELFDLKYSDKFIDALMNPMGATTAISSHFNKKLQLWATALF